MHIYTYTIATLNSAQMFSFSCRVDTELVRFFWPLLRMWVEFRYHKYCKLGGRWARTSFSPHNGSNGSCVCRRVCKCPWIPTGFIDSTQTRLRSKGEKKINIVFYHFNFFVFFCLKFLMFIDFNFSSSWVDSGFNYNTLEHETDLFKKKNPFSTFVCLLTGGWRH